MSEHYDSIVIGAGQAGPPLAGRLTASGRKVALIERKLIGGTCVNTGCMPTKAMVASAYAAHLARRSAEFGVGVGPVTVDMKAVKARKDRIVGNSRNRLTGWLQAMANCTVIEGQARFVGAHAVQVGEDVFSADEIFINVGGRALVPDMPGLDRIQYLTNTSLLELDAVPEHLVVIGGSYIGLEFAQIFRRFGSQVTVVEKGTRLVTREDADISLAVQETLEAEGIAIRVNAECISFEPHGAKIGVGVSCTTGAPSVEGSHVLLAVGRVPNTDDLGLDVAGVVTDPHGYIRVDEQLRTNVAGIWAMGDCNGQGAFTHTSYNDFEIVAANLLDGEARRVSDRIATYALFVDPPLGRVGMTEAQARESGRAIRVGMRPMTRVGRAVEKGETQGFMKVVVDAATDEILGAAVLGVGGDEAVHGILDTMAAKATATSLRHTVHIHPTVSELIPTMLGELT